MANRFDRNARSTDIWPGFVDALSTLLLVLIFLLIIFVVAEFFLGRVLSGRENELANLKNAIVELESMLSIEQTQSRDLRGELNTITAQLTAANQDREDLSEERNALRLDFRALEDRRDALATERDANAAGLEELQLRLAESQAALAAARADHYDATVEASDTRAALSEERRLSDDARRQVSLLNVQIARLRSQLATIQQALDASERTVEDQNVRIEDLGSRLNVALASRVEELQRARSVFFGELRDVLAGRSDVRIDGDRFVIQSGVLFTSGSDELGEEGRRQVADLAALLLQISEDIPDDVEWVLRIDGHTDRRPIRTARFQSNWALAAARAITVAGTLIENGVPPHRLMTAGFGEFQPIDDAESEDAYRRNRRIELKLTQR